MPNAKPCVLDVGNCDPDHGSICRLLSRFDVDVDRVMFVDDAIAALGRRTYDLVLVNRLVFADSSDALPLITRMKSDETLRDVPVIMVSNFKEAQDRAVSAGALRGFGKSDLSDDATVELLRPHLAPLAAEG